MDIIDLTHSGSTQRKSRIFRINPIFQETFQLGMIFPIKPWEKERQELSSLHKQGIIDLTPPSKETIENHCIERWNQLLSFIVMTKPSTLSSTSTTTTTIHATRTHSSHRQSSQIIEKFILRANLMASSSSSTSTTGTSTNNLTITAKGYEFILKNYAYQVWDFLMDTVHFYHSPIEILTFLFSLSYTEHGQGYPINALTIIQQQFLIQLAEVGIVYIPPPPAATTTTTTNTSESMEYQVFYPTYTAISMLFGMEGIQQHQQQLQQHQQPSTTLINYTASIGKLFVIVETNLQVTAYVQDELHFALLQLFVEIRVRLPNMAMGRITRDKCKEAFRMGMKAAQIIDFLMIHAHPKLLSTSTSAQSTNNHNNSNNTLTTQSSQKRIYKLPPSVTDQIILWENETKRIQMEDALVIDCSEVIGMTTSLFQDLVNYLKTQPTGSLHIWSNIDKMLVASFPQAESVIVRFIRDRLR
jgi:transcription initiation factor TFIIH subunit 4